MKIINLENPILNKWLNIGQNRRKRLIIPGIIASIGFLFVGMMVWPFGPLITFHSDGFMYLWGSKFIYEPNLIPYLNYPPLHSILYSIPQFFGLDRFLAASLVDAVGFGTMMFICTRVLLDHTRSIIFVVLGSFSLFFSNEFLQWYSNVYSEGIYTIFHTSFALALTRYIRNHSIKNLLVLASLAGLCVLQRYIGSVAVIFGCLVLLSPLHKVPLYQRIKYTLIFGSVASAPVGIWLLRNWYLTGVFRGTASESSPFLPIMFKLLSKLSGSLFRLGHFTPDLRIIVFILLIATILLVVFIEKDKKTRLLIGILCGFIASYLVYYGILRQIGAIEMSFRLIVPLVPSLLIVYVIGMDRIWHFCFSRFQHQPKLAKLWIGLRNIGIVIWFLLLIKAVIIDVKYAQNLWENGWANHSNVVTRKAVVQSDLIQWLRENKFDGEIVTVGGGYGEHLVFLYTGKGAEPPELKKRKRMNGEKLKKLIILFNEKFPKDGVPVVFRKGPLFPTDEELETLGLEASSLEEVANFSDSAVFRVVDSK
ncbi:MAG: hypothetical protein HQM13_24105 [SAR324 cluster bacterium]|nr:hypothetical protein [SAR324 cluster bacterium]